MRILITITAVTILLLGLGACSHDDTPTAVGDVPTIVGGAKDGLTGAQVVRYDDALAIIYTDVARNLQLIVGVDIEEYCTVGFYPDICHIMEITNPVDQDVVNQFIHSRGVRAAVFPLYDFDCGRYVSEGPIASGTADFVYTDNDLYAWVETNDNPRVNSYITKLNGTLYTPDGQRVLLNYTWKLVWPGYPDFDQVRELRSDILLAFTGD